MIIGLAGKMRSGKDTVADHLVDEHSYTRVGLADKIKEAISIIIEIPVQDSEAYGRDTPMPWLNNVTIRELWQTLGTEWGRQLVDNDIWLKLADLTETSVISDIRFDNEADYVRSNSGLIIHIIRPSILRIGNVHDHKSEQGVTIKPGDHIIFNDSSIEELCTKATNILRLCTKS